jgi:uracil-DNA glycosylase family protein
MVASRSLITGLRVMGMRIARVRCTEEDRLATRVKPYAGSAASYVPERPTLEKVRAAAKGCKACWLWTLGTQTVFGEGPRQAEVMLVGEQPGDQEDKAGRPFVGPAGKLLDRALDEAGIDRMTVYVTNAVKHFKWERGEKSTRRIHKKPNDPEIRACRPWLDAEIALVQPRVIVTLGATASQALLGKQFRVTKERGKPIASPLAQAVFATVHPSAVLRAPDPAARALAEQELTADLKKVARYLAAHPRRPAERGARVTATRTERRSTKTSSVPDGAPELPMAARGRR